MNSYTHRVTKNKQTIAYFTDRAEAKEFANDIEGNVYKIPAIPVRYLAGLEGEEFEQRVKEILKERKSQTYKPLPSDNGVKTERSKWSEKFESVFGRKPRNVADVSKLTGFPARILQQVYDKGLAAWSTGGHRRGASQHAWAMARVQSFVLGGPTAQGPDKSLYDMVVR
jgi:hypothetical protein